MYVCVYIYIYIYMCIHIYSYSTLYDSMSYHIITPYMLLCYIVRVQGRRLHRLLDSII